MKYPFEVEVDWCKLKEMEECEAFLDCPNYDVEWFDCEECKYHSRKTIQETSWGVISAKVKG